MQSKWWIGAHVSACKGPAQALIRAVDIGANAFAFFSKNQQQWNAKPLQEEQCSLFRQLCQRYAFTPKQILVHASYLINLGNPYPEMRMRSQQALCDELMRVKMLGLNALNLHPGSSLNVISEEESLDFIAQGITCALQAVSEVSVVLENTAGQGSNLGFRLKQLAKIIEAVPKDLRDRVAVCIDTCHAFAAGYDLSTFSGCREFFDELNQCIGLHRIQGFHLNGSKKGLGSRLDRHAPLSEGEMGQAVFQYLMQEKKFMHVPMILETPCPEKWKEEILWLRSLA